MKYPHLYSSLDIGKLTIKNRIMTSGHQTTLVDEHLPTDDFVAYHTERAKGGVGLIVMEAHGVHKTGLNTPHAIDASNPEIIKIHSELADNVHKYGSRLFAQLMHNGREAYPSDDQTVTVAPSAIPTERFHTIPRELEEEEIEDIIEGFVKSAIHCKEAGVDGVELVGSHAYLLAQFWSPKMNIRKDQWGGSFENRLRFAREVIKRVRSAVGSDLTLGMRISLESMDDVGASTEESLKIIRHLNDLGLLDYWSLVIGSSATHKGSSFIVPPQTESADNLFHRTNEVRKIINPLPLIITSRIYQPAIAENMLAQGIGDVMGMTRALIADPHMPNKTLEDKEDQVIPCIACNQGCIGRYQEHLPIRCTVNPRTGRERYFDEVDSAEVSRNVTVVGGGPAGLIAAIIAKKRGHQVEIIEAKKDLGGQLKVMLGAIHKEQVETWHDFLINEVKRLEIPVHLGKRFHADEVKNKEVDALILATGSKPSVPAFSTDLEYTVYSAWDVLKGQEIMEESVLVIDWKGDWPGVEAAEYLASQGKNTELVSATYGIGESLQQYIRHKALENLDKYGVKQTPQFKLVDMESNRLKLKHLFSGREEIRHPEAVVLAIGNDSTDSLQLYRSLKGQLKEVHRVGDAYSPRSLDEAVWEGFNTGMKV
ncbi:oxidoreductase [Thalassobacillus devorans]|uniref:oxidoreductase n=1 Tax=Thalassobacillus devorans TaxID=279813 RepID=UPI000A1CB195|nr:FAD-dependent oxidoreductase [Thalassobacillus devorans]